MALKTEKSLKKGFNPSSLTLCAVVTGLSVMTGCAPNAVEPTMTDPSLTIDRSNDPVVARVDGSPIYRLDVRRAAEAQGLIGEEEALGPEDAVFVTTLDELIDQRLLALDALRTGVASDEEAKRRLAAAQDRILGNYRVERHLSDTVTDEAIRELYDAQRALAGQGEERQLRQIILPDEATALEVAARLADAEGFGAMIAEYAPQNPDLGPQGDMGWLSRNMMSEGLAAQAFSTTVGGRSSPFQVGAAWHIVEVMDTRMPLSRSFYEVREDIERFLTYEAVDELMTELRDRAAIERVDPSDFAQPASSTTRPEDIPSE